MSKTHASLSPTTNVLLTIAWGSFAAILLFVIEPHVPLIIGLLGAFLGFVCGILQHLSLKQATNGFAAAASLLDVRRSFTSTTWGRRYIWWFYCSKVVLVLSAIIFVRSPLLSVFLAYLAGYLSLMFMRELITLKDTFSFQRNSSVIPPS